MAPKTNHSQSDFNPLDLSRKSDQHDQDITDLKERLDSLEERFGTNEKIAETLCNASETAVKMQTMLKGVFLKLLHDDKQITDKMSDMIGEYDRDKLSVALNGIGKHVVHAIIFISGVVATVAIQNIFK